MRKLLLGLSIVLGIVALGASLFYFVSVSNLTFEESYRQNENAVLLDIRTPEEYATGHLQDAINIDFYASDFVAQVEALAQGKDIYLYCRSGSRSAQAERVLKERGHTIESMEGGILSYKGNLEQ